MGVSVLVDGTLCSPSDLFLSSRQMVQGFLLINMISHAEPPPAITPGAFDVTLPTLVTVQVSHLTRCVLYFIKLYYIRLSFILLCYITLYT